MFLERFFKRVSKNLKRLIKQYKTLKKNLKILSSVTLHQPTLELNYRVMLEDVLYKAPNTDIIKPKIYTRDETVEYILKTKSSLARFGDGELAIINGHDIPYQKYNPELAVRLKDILKNNQEGLCVGINYWYYYTCNYNPLSPDSILNFNLYSMPKHRMHLNSLIDFSKQYFDAGFTGHKEYNEKNVLFFNKIRELWGGGLVACVCCAEARNALQYNIFDNAADCMEIFVPNKNAYCVYQKTLDKLLTINKNRLIVLMCGPLGKVLASDLHKEGYWALDLGHIAKSYDYFMRNITWTSEAVVSFFSPDV